jgi:competence protein ComEA
MKMIRLTVREKAMVITICVLLSLNVVFIVMLPDDSLEENNYPIIQEKTSKLNDKAQPEKEKQSIEIVVDVKGAIKKPGVYSVTDGKRIIDVINKAGGLLESADANKINFAAIVRDEMVIYVPEKGEEVIPTITSSPKKNNKININTASVNELIRLQGIGQAKASAIVRYRKENGKFEKIEELIKVTGIGEKTIENFREHVVVR